MQDIASLLSKTWETFYNIKVNAAKKITTTYIREIVINSKECWIVQTATKTISKKF